MAFQTGIGRPTRCTVPAMRYAYALVVGLILLGCGEDNAATGVETPAENNDTEGAGDVENEDASLPLDSQSESDASEESETDTTETGPEEDTIAESDATEMDGSDSDVETLPDTPTAIFKDDRSGFWLDRPFPGEDIQREDGTLDWEILPEAPGFFGNLLVEGWAGQAALASAVRPMSQRSTLPSRNPSQ